ncbi:MAG: PLDc_N domain-containing protein [Acidimicrobiaceae bacterium]|nr:PLDc_N domain-containing protein [Acidimicrobiaceae bacterium]
MFASGYPMFGVFVSTLYFMILIFWIILVFHVFQDIFRSHDLIGGAKALWVVFILVLPLIGCLIYLVARGGSMHERQMQVVKAQQKAFEDYIRQVANTKE